MIAFSSSCTLHRFGFSSHSAACFLSWLFSMTSYASFQRQLNLYGFKSLSQGPDKGGYYHEMFLRRQPDLAARMIRQKLKGKPNPSEDACAADTLFLTHARTLNIFMQCM
jgi:hypothetical protein